jgi:hypothetical protein
MVNYQNGKIYKIIDYTNDNIYIGSTCEKLCRRIQKHKASYKCYLNPNVKQGYMRSFDILKNNNFKIILIEDYPCKNKEQLLSREQYWIDKLNCINHNNPIHDNKKYQQKWRDNNRDKINNIINKKYRENNRDKMNERNRLYRYSVSINNINKIDIDLFT